MKKNLFTPSTPWLLLPVLLSSSGIIAIRHQSTQLAPPPAPVTTLNQSTKTISQITSFFYTRIFLNRDKTFISVPYRFTPENDQPLWLILLLEDNDTLLRLIHHPVIAALSWPYLEDDGVRLYQRHKNYASLNQFISRPPSKSTLLIDLGLKDQPWFNTLQGTPFSPQASHLNLEGYNYLLTTYQPSRLEGDWSYFETIIDASQAFVNDKDELVWEVNAPQANLNRPYILGTIHVDYRQ